MSAPRSVSIGVSSFSFNQDLIKLRQCLGSTEPDNSIDETEASSSLEKSAYLHAYNRNRPEDNQFPPNVASPSQASAAHSSNNASVRTEDSVPPSKQEVYLKDHSIEAALVTNEMYQEALKEAIARLDMALVKNLERQNAVQYELDHTKEERDQLSADNKQPKMKAMHWLVLCAPYLKDLDGFPFPENSDAKYKRLNNEISPYVTEPQKWTKHDQALLYGAVKSDLKKKKTQPLLQKKEIICSRLRNRDFPTELLQNLALNLEEINSEINEKINLPDHELMCEGAEDVDWMKISTVEFEGLHSPECCEIMWKNTVHPNIYKGFWTQEEDNRLVEIVKKHEFQDWDAIANELGSKRTAEQCIKRYNAHLNPEMILKGSWTCEENNILRELVDELRVGDTIPWGKVSSYLESRHPSAVRKHWQRTLNHEIKRGNWSLEEDIMLVMGVKKYGMKFQNICQLFPDRTYLQCRERFLNSLSMDVSFEKWSREDDTRLISLAKEKGTRWTELVEFFPGRTPRMIRQRFAVILKYVPDAYDLVERDFSEWPYTPTHYSYNTTIRRRKVYAHISSRSNILKNHLCGSLPKMRSTVTNCKAVKRVLSSEHVEFLGGFSSELRNPKHVDFILHETKNIMDQQKQDKIVPQESRKKLFRSSAVDNALDSLLFPTIVCKKSGFKKGLALKGKDAQEFETCRTSLLKALNIPEEKEEICYTHNQLPSEPACTEIKSKVNKLDLRSEFFSHGIQQTILKQCLGDVSRDGCSVLPPMRTSVNAFKLMVMDRKRVIELASSADDASMIQKITESSANEKLKCSVHSRIQEENESLSDDVSETTGATFGSYENSEISIVESQDCSDCSQLQRLHSDYNKFKNRFISLFFWPAQMYLLSPPETSIDPSPEYFVMPYVKHCGRKRRKRSVKEKECSEEEPKKPRKTRESKYQNMCPVRSSARQAKKYA